MEGAAVNAEPRGAEQSRAEPSREEERREKYQYVRNSTATISHFIALSTLLKHSGSAFCVAVCFMCISSKKTLLLYETTPFNAI